MGSNNEEQDKDIRVERYKNEKNSLMKFIKLIKNIALGAIAVLFVLVLVFDSFYYVDEQQNAVVTMFGAVERTDTAGLYFKLPFIEEVEIVDITTHGIGIGYQVSNEVNNGYDTAYDYDSDYSAAYASDFTDSVMITSDFNLLNIDFYLEYRVSDPVAYIFNSNNPEEMLRNIAQSSIRSTVVNYTVDEAMTTSKGLIQSDVKEDISKELLAHNIGISVVNITIQDSEPPTQEIIQAFKAVETAKQGADTAKNNALKYQNEQLPAAEAQADKIVQEAEGTKRARIAEAEGQVARFNKMYEEYKDYPLITRKRLFYETMEDVLPQLKVIITDGKSQSMLPLESFTE